MEGCFKENKLPLRINLGTKGYSSVYQQSVMSHDGQQSDSVFSACGLSSFEVAGNIDERESSYRPRWEMLGRYERASVTIVDMIGKIIINDLKEF